MQSVQYRRGFRETMRGLAVPDNGGVANDSEEAALATKLNPYINFRDNARQAMEFYQSVFGGELTLSTFADFHGARIPRRMA